MSSRSPIEWLRKFFRMLGWVGALISTSLLIAAQTAPDVQFTDITAQSRVDFVEFLERIARFAPNRGRIGHEMKARAEYHSAKQQITNLRHTRGPRRGG